MKGESEEATKEQLLNLICDLSYKDVGLGLEKWEEKLFKKVEAEYERRFGED